MKKYFKESRKREISYAIWTGHILPRNCLLKHVTERKIQWRLKKMKVRRGWRRKHLLYGLKEKRGYCKFKEEVLNRPLWRTHFGRGYRHFARQTSEWVMNIGHYILQNENGITRELWNLLYSMAENRRKFALIFGRIVSGHCLCSGRCNRNDWLLGERWIC
jgi:hypothetical protein